MPCMCGDPYCGSCGPAQGNTKCHYCGAWSADGGCQNPQVCTLLGKIDDLDYKLIDLQSKKMFLEDELQEIQRKLKYQYQRIS